MKTTVIKVPYTRGDWSNNGFIGRASDQSLITELEIYPSATGATFYIQPVNSAGTATAPVLRLPRDIAMLTELIDALDKIRATIASTGDSDA